jgi:hypothetical protein
MNQNM